MARMVLISLIICFTGYATGAPWFPSWLTGKTTKEQVGVSESGTKCAAKIEGNTVVSKTSSEENPENYATTETDSVVDGFILVDPAEIPIPRDKESVSMKTPVTPLTRTDGNPSSRPVDTLNYHVTNPAISFGNSENLWVYVGHRPPRKADRRT